MQIAQSDGIWILTKVWQSLRINGTEEGSFRLKERFAESRHFPCVDTRGADKKKSYLGYFDKRFFLVIEESIKRMPSNEPASN